MNDTHPVPAESRPLFALLPDEGPPSGADALSGGAGPSGADEPPGADGAFADESPGADGPFGTAEPGAGGHAGRPLLAIGRFDTRSSSPPPSPTPWDPAISPWTGARAAR
ncbi:hypothetical protein NKH77_48925 [Streptomyces sp. M19]